MATSSSSTISSPGIGSGLDVNTIVAKLMTAEQGPLNNVTKQKTAYQTQISAYGTLKSSLSAFQTAVSTLSKVSQFTAQSVTSGDSSVYTATADGTATLGNYAVEVSQLAQQQKLVLPGFSATSATIGTGTLSISFGTYDSVGNTFTQNSAKATKSITIDPSNNTLAGIRDAINNAGAGVTATIVNDGTTNGNRLVITSTDSGTANSIKITTSDADGNNLDNSGLSQLAYDPTAAAGAGKNMSELQAAKDAILNIDGITVTKSSNTITDAISGVTLNLLKTNSGSTANLGVTRNVSAIETSVNAFVKAYNDLNTTVRKLTSYDDASKTGGPLLGDGTINSIVSQVRNIITGTIGSSGTLTTLSSIGVAFQRDGTLAVDSTKLEAGINDHFSDIAALFTAGASTTDAQISYAGNTSKTTAGNYAVTVSSLATQGALTGSAAPNLNITSGVNDTLNLTIDGIAVNITLTAGVYASAQALAAEIQSRIAGASSSANVSVSGGALQITSNTYGSSSAVTITGGNGATDILGGAPTTTAGTNVAGTINGVAATGQGQNLIGATGDVSEGLSLKVTGGSIGARGTANFTMGFAYQLNTLTTNILADDGMLATKTDGINSSITRLTSQQDALNARLTMIEANYRAQFSALDTLISSMQTTSSFLTQQLAQISANSTNK
jgi:flagellar hook-associated protein 2